MLEIHAIAGSPIRVEGSPARLACDAGNLVRRFRRRPFRAETSFRAAQR